MILAPNRLLAGAAALAVLSLSGSAQTVVDDFENGVNQGGWSFGNPADTLEPTGGNPGAHLRNDTVDTFAPRLRTTTPGSPFLGDWRADGVSAFGVDLRVWSTQFPYAREATLRLSASDGSSVYFLGVDMIPQPGQGWRSFDYAIPVADATLPAGWFVDPNSTIQTPDVAWNTVITDVALVELFFGDPQLFYIFDLWDTSADNARITQGGGDPVGTSYCVAAPNSTGAGALISGAGSASVAADDLTLSAAPVPAFQSGVFFYGPDQVQVPFGDGFRCVGGGASGLQRLPVEVADASGVITHGLDYGMPPTPSGAILPGSTWNFQCWYRDPAAGGATFNLSDGLQVTFLP